MNPERNKCERIKKLVELASNCEDVGKRTRKRPFPELKKIYAKLCKLFTLASLEVIGDVLGGYDHATALHAINTFDDLISSNGLDLLEVYENVFKKLTEERKALSEAEGKGEVPLTVHELNQKYRISLIKIIEKGHSIINKKDDRIKVLELLLNESFELTNPDFKRSLEELYSFRARLKRELLK
jgi:hypothetical protein